IRVFDISDKADPQYVTAVPTDCGSHTNTLVPGKDGEHEYVYVSSYSPRSAFPNCQPPHDKITVIEVPLDDPASAEVLDTPVLFPDGGNAGTSGCHDITAYPEGDVAAGACMGDGILMDISDPAEPVVTDVVRDENFAFWHSATFTNRGETVLFTDELGGGGGPTCNEGVGPERGANAIYTIGGTDEAPEMAFEGYYKLPRHQADTENCVAHNGSLIPTPGRDFFVQAWYQGGVSVIDFNDPTDATEIAYFDRDPIDDSDLVVGGSWSAYYYNGYVYSSDITRGLDVIKLEDPRFRVAERVVMDEFNPQSQPVYRPGRGHGR
ncbi:LVIVD repeat-containing protein, partial [Nocardiopsis lucentensis]